MPTISGFYGIIIQMFWRDHNPFHFHARYGNSRALVSIVDLSILEGGLPRIAERLVIQWARDHQSELLENWRLCTTKEQPNKIEPLP